MRRARIAAAALAGAVAACSSNGGGGSTTDLSIEELRDPETCRDCHEGHYQEWAGSMHAYAADDPVFIAMNQRGQEETNGELGDFCVSCHAPMLGQLIESGDLAAGTTLQDLKEEGDPNARGVTCYFCHNVESVEGTHNNPLRLAHDNVMRGGIGGFVEDKPQLKNAEPPRDNSAHRSAYSTLLDGSHNESSDLCGSCHDIVNSNDVHLERTFAEWKESFGNKPSGSGGRSTCGSCHMAGYDAPAADDPDAEVFERRSHRHLWPGVDVAITEFPGRDVQKAAIDCEFKEAILVTLSPASSSPPYNSFSVLLESQLAHAWPSGAVQDRRAWVEFVAYDADDNVIFESGVIGDDEVMGSNPDDAQLWWFGDKIYDAEGEEVHMFWEAEKSEAYPEGYESNLLPVPASRTIGNNNEPKPHTIEKVYTTPGVPARVRVSLKIRTMSLAVIDDIIDSGHLPESFRDEIRTITVTSSQREWTSDLGSRSAKYPPLDLELPKCPDSVEALLDR